LKDKMLKVMLSEEEIKAIVQTAKREISLGGL